MFGHFQHKACKCSDWTDNNIPSVIYSQVFDRESSIFQTRKLICYSTREYNGDCNIKYFNSLNALKVIRFIFDLCK